MFSSPRIQQSIRTLSMFQARKSSSKQVLVLLPYKGTINNPDPNMLVLRPITTKNQTHVLDNSEIEYLSENKFKAPMSNSGIFFELDSFPKEGEEAIIIKDQALTNKIAHRLKLIQAQWEEGLILSNNKGEFNYYVRNDTKTIQFSFSYSCTQRDSDCAVLWDRHVFISANESIMKEFSRLTKIKLDKNSNFIETELLSSKSNEKLYKKLPSVELTFTPYHTDGDIIPIMHSFEQAAGVVLYDVIYKKLEVKMENNDLWVSTNNRKKHKLPSNKSPGHRVSKMALSE